MVFFWLVLIVIVLLAWFLDPDHNADGSYRQRDHLISPPHTGSQIRATYRGEISPDDYNFHRGSLAPVRVIDPSEAPTPKGR